ncbi:MAG: hypothetical protein PUJ60_04365 [bacterium]|nr:hypothetical protein [bacterium]MDY4108318.1 hypothetical protein [Bacilli bacterium]
MKNAKIGLYLIILGNLLYVSYIFFGQNETSNLGEFTSGLLLGLSISINLVGIILSAISLAKEQENKKSNM